MQNKDSDAGGDYFGRDPIDAAKAIVFIPALSELFNVCNIPMCGAACDKENRNIHYSGAMVCVSVVCNNGHKFSWKSSPTIGQGKKKVAVINVLLGSYGYLCGINVKKVNYVLHRTMLNCFFSSWSFSDVLELSASPAHSFISFRGGFCTMSSGPFGSLCR